MEIFNQTLFACYAFYLLSFIIAAQTEPEFIWWNIERALDCEEV
jgi:hypothetical protein